MTAIISYKLRPILMAARSSYHRRHKNSWM